MVRELVARDPRVLAILTGPDDYFSDARRKAWEKAREDVATDLERRARRRRGGARANSIRVWPDQPYDHA